MLTDEDLELMAKAIDVRVAKWAEEMKPFLLQMTTNQMNHEDRIKALEQALLDEPEYFDNNFEMNKNE